MPYFAVHLYGPDGSFIARCAHEHPERNDAETCLARKAAGYTTGGMSWLVVQLSQP